MVSLVLITCQTNKQYTSRPTKSLINPDSDLLEVNAVAYHTNDTVTMAYLEIKNENLLYKRPDTTQAFYAELRISYKLLSEQNSKKILDSSSYYITERSDDEHVKIKSLYSQFSLRVPKGGNYYLETEIHDLNKRTKYIKSLNINKTNGFSEQNFLVTRGDTVIFKNVFFGNDEALIRFSNVSVTQVTVDCFFKELGPALPPFSTKEFDELKYKPDSFFIVALTGDRYSLKMPEKGFYHIKADPRSNEGITLFTYDKTFPGVSNSNEMISCTRYIMNREEFETCRNAPEAEKKNCIDDFWLNLGGSNERAKELLRRYYGRVKEANKNFTSYAQGWKSDRGMVFIVFGPPTNVYRSKKDEIWVYGNEANPSVLRLIFNKADNPLSDNDFVMERSQFYKEAWYSAVEYWRQGLIYIEGRR